MSNSAESPCREEPDEERFTSVIDANHQLVIPGLHDAHIHVCMTGESSYFLDLKDCHTIDQLVKSLSDHSAKHSVGSLPWIQGVNWDQVGFLSTQLVA
jgi:predicted amidohydrolase YtcJ